MPAPTLKRRHPHLSSVGQGVDVIPLPLPYYWRAGRACAGDDQSASTMRWTGRRHADRVFTRAALRLLLAALAVVLSHPAQPSVDAPLTPVPFAATADP